MAESGHKLGSIHLSKEAFEGFLNDGLQSINALMQLSKENELTLTQEDWQSITSALYAINLFQRKMYRSITKNPLSQFQDSLLGMK